MRAGLRTVALLPRRLDFWGITTGFRHDTSSSSADDLSIAVQLLRDSVTICVAPPSPRMAELQERKQTLRRQLHDLRLQVRRPLAHVQWMLMLWERYPCRSRQNGPSHEKIIRLWYFYCIFLC